MSKKRRLVIQFARAPVAGQVKTRLFSQFSPEQAAALHCELMLATAEVLTGLSECDFELQIAGSMQHPFLSRFLSYGYHLLPQVEGDLGEKMRAAINEGLRNYDQVLLVGSDCPVLSVKILEQAFDRLICGCDLVLIPAEDGGYVLIGACKPLPDTLFCNVRWGESQVLRQTRINAERLDMAVDELAALWDVDYPEDVVRWQHWRRENSQGG